MYLGDDKPLRENIDDWSLNLKTKTWRRLTTRNWRTLELMREDKSRNRFWEIRQAIWNNEVKWRESYEKSIQQLENDFGQKPQLDIFEKLYEFDFDHSPVKEHDEENNTYWIEVGEVIVRFLEDHYYLRVIIEGDLAKNKIEHIQESLKAKLSELENCVYILEAY